MVNLGDRFSEVMRLWASPFIRNPIYKFFFEHGLSPFLEGRHQDFLDFLVTLTNVHGYHSRTEYKWRPDAVANRTRTANAGPHLPRFRRKKHTAVPLGLSGVDLVRRYLLTQRIVGKKCPSIQLE
jgi:hypothetical protein